jgi:phage FluMu protein Com
LNPEIEKQLEGCIFSQIQCIYCGKLLQRPFIQDHQETKCLERSTCEFK